MVAEAGKLLDEGVIASVDSLDLATVLGIGFAPFRGGLAHFGALVDRPSVAREKSNKPVIEPAVARPR
jgi:hypothetical protein